MTPFSGNADDNKTGAQHCQAEGWSDNEPGNDPGGDARQLHERSNNLTHIASSVNES
jgi:hypothetical protein